MNGSKLLILNGLLLCSFCCSATFGEPTNAKESATTKAEEDQKLDKQYQTLIKTLSQEEQAWERVLQENLGNFYLPIHKRQKVAGQSNAWDFVKDDPSLPRILLIGDSVSRGYTQTLRRELVGKANVHRAPANCGPTSLGLKNIEVWLGDGEWDVIHFNFGIHDRNTPITEYRQRLEQIVKRLQMTGAKLIWASTTPIPDDAERKQTSQSIVERNKTAAEIMANHGVATNDLFDAVSPRLGEMQNPNDVHFNPAGYEFLGQRVADAISAELK